jgi:hypothetical protein
MMMTSVSGVFPVFQVDLMNLTQLQPMVSKGRGPRVSGVSGLSRMQAYVHTLLTALIQISVCFFMREEKPNTPDTPDTVTLKSCFIKFFGVLGLCQVWGFSCRVRFFGGRGR